MFSSTTRSYSSLEAIAEQRREREGPFGFGRGEIPGRQKKNCPLAVAGFWKPLEGKAATELPI